MAFTYDPTLPDNISKIRFYIGDTQSGKGARPGNINFEDAEITAMLTAHSNSVEAAVAMLFDVLASEWSKYAISFTMGPRKEELYRISSRFESKSREWANKAGISYHSFSHGFVRSNANS